MKTTRLEAFSDGVIAIIITIMVLELKVPHDTSLGSLLEMWPVFFSYALSFITVAIYWMNHHHLIHMVRRIDSGVMWANMGFLFVLSLLPFATAYLGENHGARLAVAVYGLVTTACGIAYYALRHAVACQTRDEPKLQELHRCMLRKNRLAAGIHLLAVSLVFVSTWLSLAILMLPAAMYFIPDKQVEKLIGETE